MRPLTAKISTEAFVSNINYLSQISCHKKFAAVKANAYGHGLQNILPLLEKFDGFSVAFLSEALELKKILPNNKKPVVILAGAMSKDEYPLIGHNNFELVIHNHQQLKDLSETKIKPKKVWLKINTGMNRLGFKITENNIEQDLQNLRIVIKKLKAIGFDSSNLNLMAHLSQSENQESSFTKSQKLVFKKVIENIGDCFFNFSIANSGELMYGQNYDYELKSIPDWKIWDRLGITIYGVDCNNKIHPKLKPVMNLVSKIISLQLVQKGESVGYGEKWISQENEQLIAHVDGGYADCYPYSAGNAATVLIKNTICPVVGNISMDRFMVNVSHLENVNLMEEVLIWGDNHRIEKVANELNCIPYSLLTGISPRVIYKAE